MSENINATNALAGGGAPYMGLFSPSIGTGYLGLYQTPGVNGVVSGTWTAPAGVTQVVIIDDTDNATVAAGLPISWSQPQFYPNIPNYNYCWGNSAPSSMSGIDSPVTVWCSTGFDPTSTTTRVVTLDACPSTVSGAQCMASPSLQTTITLDDYPQPQGTPSTTICITTCGESMTVSGWIWES
jgi:hypothetical protein